jgi:hypothetical protein
LVNLSLTWLVGIEIVARLARQFAGVVIIKSPATVVLNL